MIEYREEAQRIIELSSQFLTGQINAEMWFGNIEMFVLTENKKKKPVEKKKND